jgi:hypothetical protein
LHTLHQPVGRGDIDIADPGGTTETQPLPDITIQMLVCFAAPQRTAIAAIVVVIDPFSPR